VPQPRSQFGWHHGGLPSAALAALLFALADAQGGDPFDRGWIAFDSNRMGNFEIFMMKPDGTRQVQLTRDPAYDSFWPKPAPDSKTILFVRAPAGVHDNDYSKVTTWIMNSDGSGVRQLLPLGVYGWSIQGHPEWKPDGTKIVTIGGVKSNSQIYILNPDGSDPVRVTSNGSGKARGGTNIDPSWHPDGKSLLFIGCPMSFCIASSHEIYRINADGSGETRLTGDQVADYDPYYSPSGRQIAWLRNSGGARWGIYRMRLDGSGQQPVIDDGGINSKPAWSHDAAAIFFHRIPPSASPGSVFNIWKITPEGKDLIEIITPRPPYVSEYPAVITH